MAPRFKLSLEEVLKKAEQGILDDSNIATPPYGLEEPEEFEEQPAAEEEKDASERRKSA